ncbi:hypothetical protein E2N92_05050 [Methanofollis formosanus]|uniref:Uncharacterized protein n=1 Tax=Methanofollis formosanus TaxID=299308 RepID=A0A8G1EFK7_9EURY|nr:hypothetical protein [Methanofollis formosanus]QYZ78840.1 hypothetical protein E2N92_05050 [Methanofollis formosanus]
MFRIHGVGPTTPLTQRGTRLICWWMLIFLALVPAGAVGLQVGVEGDLPGEVAEGEEVNFTLTLAGLPPAADDLVLETDLVPEDGTPLFSVEGTETVSNSTPFIVPLPAGNGPLKIAVTGQAPRAADVRQCGAVTLTTYDPRLSGYAYYRVRFTDDEGNRLAESDTRVFALKVEAIEEFNEKLGGISDPFMDAYLQDLFDKGLVGEANALADHELAKESTVPTLWAVAGIVLAAVLALVIGIRIGGREYEVSEE